MSEPRSWCTVCPLLNLDVGLKIPVYFAKGLWLTLIPDWLRQDGWTELLSSSDRETLKQLQYAFVVEYEASSSGAPDPDWDGPEPRSIQDAKLEIARLAGFAMWLAKPSPAGFELVFHAPRWADGWNIQNSEKHPRFRCHPKDRYTVLSDHDLENAVALHAALCTMPRRNSVWIAIQSAWTALETKAGEVRDLLLWDALEALFGPEGAGEGECRIAQRIGAFIAAEIVERKTLIERAVRAHSFRHNLMHGRWADHTELQESVHEAETLLRLSLGKVLRDGKLIERFCGLDRDSYLDGLA